MSYIRALILKPRMNPYKNSSNTGFLSGLLHAQVSLCMVFFQTDFHRLHCQVYNQNYCGSLISEV